MQSSVDVRALGRLLRHVVRRERELAKEQALQRGTAVTYQVEERDRLAHVLLKAHVLHRVSLLALQGNALHRTQIRAVLDNHVRHAGGRQARRERERVRGYALSALSVSIVGMIHPALVVLAAAVRGVGSRRFDGRRARIALRVRRAGAGIHLDRVHVTRDGGKPSLPQCLDLHMIVTSNMTANHHVPVLFSVVKAS